MLTIIFITSFIISVVYIVKNEKEDKKQNEVFEELENIITECQDEQKEQQQESINLQKLYELNNDFVGWLEIKNTT